MTTNKIKKSILAIWLALALILGTGIVGAHFGLDTLPTTYACGGGGSSGGC